MAKHIHIHRGKKTADAAASNASPLKGDIMRLETKAISVAMEAKAEGNSNLRRACLDAEKLLNEARKLIHAAL